jgi:hypothetical protein
MRKQVSGGLRLQPLRLTERQQIASWCYRLKVDVDSFNDNRNAGTPIQIKLNFEPDMKEMEAVDKAKRDAIKAVATAAQLVRRRSLLMSCLVAPLGDTAFSFGLSFP